jgi:hypothetical protein
MAEDPFSHRFCFEHSSGDLLYPVRMRNLETGRLAFCVSDTRVVKGLEQEAEEDDMVRLALERNYMVRMSTHDRTRHGGYRRDGRSILRVREQD